MVEIQVKEDTTVPLDVTLPRDITSNADITVHVRNGESDEIDSASALMIDVDENIIAIPLDDLTLEAGVYAIEFEINYETGYTETLPEDGYDYLHVYDDLG